MASMYTDKYLRTNAERGEGKGYTLQTFLAYELRGVAKRYADKYLKTLQRDLDNQYRSGSVVWGRSCKGGRAYYPATKETA